MKINESLKHEILKEAVIIVAHANNTTADFILATRRPRQIIAQCRALNRKREKEMDTIRSEW